MKGKLLAIAGLILIGLQAAAQQTDTVSAPQGGVWTLKQCVDYALANNLDVQRGVYGVESSEIDLRQARAAMIPTLNLGVSYGYNWGRSVDPVTYQFTTDAQNTMNPNATSSATIFNGFRLQNQVKQYSRSNEASKLDLQKTKNDISLNIASLYISVVFNKEQLENAKFQLGSSQQQLDRTKKQVAAGGLPRSEELNLDAQVATNEVNVIQRENALNLSLLQLKQALQLPASTAMDVEVPQLEVEDLVLDQSRDQIYDIAKETMPEVKSSQAKIESSEFAVRAARGNIYPRLTANAMITSNYSSASDQRRFIRDGGQTTVVDTIGVAVTGPNPGDPTYPVLGSANVPTGKFEDSYGYRAQMKDNIYRQIGVTLSIPIFNGLQAKSTYQRAIISRRLAEISAKETNNTLRQNVETAFNDAVAAAKTYQSSVRQVGAREEAFRMTKQRYEIGAANYVEYQVAENDLFRAKSDLVRAKYDFIFRKKVLDFYQGKPLDY